jgi:hypothetical protein
MRRYVQIQAVAKTQLIDSFVFTDSETVKTWKTMTCIVRMW